MQVMMYSLSGELPLLTFTALSPPPKLAELEPRAKVGQM